MVVLYDISVNGKYKGDITLSIPVGKQYIGNTLVIYHCANGKLEQVKAVVDGNGNAVGTFSSLSPFAVGITANNSTLPQTGDYSNILLWLTLAIISMVVISGTFLTRKRVIQRKNDL